MSNESENKDCKFEGEREGEPLIKHIPGCKSTFHCKKCGSHKLSWLMWVNEAGEETGEGPDQSEAYCDGCGGHGRIASDSYYASE